MMMIMMMVMMIVVVVVVVMMMILLSRKTLCKVCVWTRVKFTNYTFLSCIQYSSDAAFYNTSKIISQLFSTSVHQRKFLREGAIEYHPMDCLLRAGLLDFSVRGVDSSTSLDFTATRQYRSNARDQASVGLHFSQSSIYGEVVVRPGGGGRGDCGRGDEECGDEAAV
jgi:hypothetical protein